jgi:hypothetical protein
MNNSEFNKIVDNQLDFCKSLLCKKGEEYDSDTNDRFHSFKVAAALQNETPMQALAGMMAKHTVSIYDLIKDDSHNLAIWTEKITDHINYLLLLEGLVISEINASEEVKCHGE